LKLEAASAADQEQIMVRAHLTSCLWSIFTNTFSGNHNVNAAAVFILSCARHYAPDAETLTIVSKLHYLVTLNLISIIALTEPSGSNGSSANSVVQSILHRQNVHSHEASQH